MSNFKSAKQYKEDKYAGKFFLANDGDSADVIFLYQSEDDNLVGDVHYIKSEAYTGYVECNGFGCAACRAGLRKQTKMFIPIYNVGKGCIEFWDRANTFDAVLHTAVFRIAPNPSEFVFRITRHGAANARDTKYEITAIAKNNIASYDEICKKFNITFPEYYATICKEVDNTTLAHYAETRITNQSAASGSFRDSDYTSVMASYQAAPRVRVSPAADVSDIESTPMDDLDDMDVAEADFD